MLARDRFFPRQFVNLGDRLVYSNGIIVLAGIASLLIWVFHANVISLIHLYVIGVFTAFTLSQAGMVRYWLRRKERGWRKSAFINGFGAVATGVVTVLVIQAKFTAGAWMVVDRDPGPDRASSSSSTATTGSSPGACERARRPSRRRRSRRTRSSSTSTASIPPRSSRPGTRAQIAGHDYHPVWVEDGRRRPDPRGRWWDFTGGGTRIEPLEALERPADAVLDYVWALPRGESNFLTVVIPEHFERPSLLSAIVRRRTTFSLKLRLLSEPGIVITNVTVVAGARHLSRSRSESLRASSSRKSTPPRCAR